MFKKFSLEEISSQNQVRASAQRKIRQSIQDEGFDIDCHRKNKICYPNIMRRFQVDRGAIKFVFSGANIMCPGITSPGGVLDEEVGAERPVAIYAERKKHALAIGFTKY